jgi:hypothetical protein
MPRIIKYKGNKLLFNRFENLKWRVQGLGAITQNPEMEITEELYIEWCARAREVEKELDTLIEICRELVEDGEVIEIGEEGSSSND